MGLANLELYKLFYYVAVEGSVTGAAERLSVSQPAVSQGLKQLEEVLGARLFDRGAGGVRLTREGELLFGYVKRGYEEIRLGERKLAQMLNLDLGEIRIGASDMTLRFYLLPYLEKFHEQNPGIKVIVSNGPTPETLAALREGKIDFGVVSAPFSGKEDLEVREVGEIEDVFVAGSKFLRYRQQVLALADLEGMPLITLEKNTSTRSYMDHFLKKKDVIIHPEIELATSDMIVQFALKNMGIGMVMKEFARAELEAGNLFQLRFQEVIPTRQFCLVCRRNHTLPPSAIRLLELMKEKEMP